ncbi:MAG: metal ABC transporter substrate-binding protein [Lachnospiraceae bacterium]|nr:metal ABC transporter substrate-binding protein [Lachnospiraceae bacterium]
MKKNRIIALVTVVAMMAGMVFGCGKTDSKEESKEEPKEETKYSVVCTTFPQYDWVREILGDKKDQVELTLLLDNGVDLHSYQPTAEDVAKIAESDLFIYVGGESDTWVDDALKEASNKNMKVVNMMEAIGDEAVEEELVEGMQGEEEEGEEGEEEEVEYDEHVWLSLKNAGKIVSEIAADLEEIDAEHKEVYAQNAKAYEEKLSQLDKNYQETVDGAKKDTLLFGDRFPFRYMVKDYGLNYYAAFIGCSAETEASFETVTFLAKKVDELSLTTILTIENSDQKIANTIRENTKDKNQEIMELNSLQSITEDELNGGTTYYSIMEQNLETLKKALN